MLPSQFALNMVRYEYEQVLPLIKSDDVFLVLGACESEWAYLFPDHKFIEYEPSPVEHFTRDNIERYNKAVVGDSIYHPTAWFYFTYNIPQASTLTYVPSRHYKPYNVECIRFSEVLSKHPDATVLFIDVESSEYDYDFSLIPDNIRFIHMEEHCLICPERTLTVPGFRKTFKHSNCDSHELQHWERPPTP